MKTNVKIYAPGQDGGIVIPNCIREIAKEEDTIKVIAKRMMQFAIVKISTRPYMVGLKSMLDLTFIPVVGIDAPTDILAMRNFWVRHIAEELQALGIVEFEIVPTAQDLQMLNGYWIKISGGKVADKFGDIHLNIEEDPTGKKVVNENVAKPAVEPGPAAGQVPVAGEKA